MEELYGKKWICASSLQTHRDLKQMVEEGTFRRDLWYRLYVFPIQIPALRDRLEDLPLLLKHFTELHGKKLGFSQAPTLAPKALERLASYPWPGNIREFSNLIERALILGNGKHLALDPLMPKAQPESQAISWTDPMTVSLDQVIKETIQAALTRSHGKISGPGGAAERLDIHPNTLRSKMKKYGINK